MRFKEGQRIVFLHDVGGGVISSVVANGKYRIEDEDGFSREYLESEIAAIQSEDYRLDDEDVEIFKEESNSTKIQHVTKKVRDKTSMKEREVWEIDLHIEQITDSHTHLTNSEILRRQMNALNVFVNKARKRSIHKVVVIHGVGEGVLKHEVRSFFDNLESVNYYDADFMEYGKGATAAEFNYSY